MRLTPYETPSEVKTTNTLLSIYFMLSYYTCHVKSASIQFPHYTSSKMYGTDSIMGSSEHYLVIEFLYL